MKNKTLLITLVVFFLLVNTSYYWEGKLGLMAMPALLILVAVYLGLLIAFFYQLFLAIKEKFKQRKKNIILVFLAIVLMLTYFKPFGLIDFDKLEGDNVLIAEGEGSANCKTTLKLKDNYTFRQQSVCFGVSEVKGNFAIINDTIYFRNITLNGGEDSFYEFAVIQTDNSENKTLQYLIKFKDKNDNEGNSLYISKNDIMKLKDKKPNR